MIVNIKTIDSCNEFKITKRLLNGLIDPAGILLHNEGYTIHLVYDVVFHH